MHPPYACPGPGSILILNTIEAFKTADKKTLLEDTARQVIVIRLSVDHITLEICVPIQTLYKSVPD